MDPRIAKIKTIQETLTLLREEEGFLMDERAELARDLKQSGVSYAATGRELGISKNLVSGWVNRL